jgi:hypothetical protein
VVECVTVLVDVWTFLDGECATCLRHYAVEGRIKNLIATKCGGDKAPSAP